MRCVGNLHSSHRACSLLAHLGGHSEAIGCRRVGQVVGQVLQGRLAGDQGLHQATQGHVCNRPLLPKPASASQTASASHTHLHEEAEHGEHGEAAVLQLLDLQLGQGVGVVSQAQGVKGAACRPARAKLKASRANARLLTRRANARLLTRFDRSPTGVQGVAAGLHGALAGITVRLGGAHDHQLGQQHSHDGLGMDQGGVACIVRASGARAGVSEGLPGAAVQQAVITKGPLAKWGGARSCHSPR